MSAPSADRVRLSDPADLIAAVPHLLGFHPHNSIVLLTLHGKMVGLTLRADLVDLEHAPLLTAHMLPPISRQRPSGVVVIVIGGDLSADGDPPHRALVEFMAEALGSAGLPLVHATWAAATAAGARWCCYHDPRCSGVVADPATTPLAAVMVAAGGVTFTNREELASLLASDDPEVLERRSALLRAADADHPLSEELRARRLARIDELHREASAAPGHLELTDDTVAEIASALCDVRVRDACLTWCVGRGAVAAERLWLAFVRATPAPERAEPAALLALVAYLRGDGALAGMALDVALQAHPHHSLSALLRQALAGGITPDVLRTIAMDAAEDLALRASETAAGSPDAPGVEHPPIRRKPRGRARRPKRGR